jgi:PAS domain S-box-containing protein
MPDRPVLADQLDARDRLLFRYRLLPTRAFDYLSESTFAITGYPPEAFADADLGFKAVYPDDRERLEQFLAAQAREDTPLTMRFRRFDGSLMWAEFHFAYIRDAANRATAIEGVVRDVTPQKHTEQRMAAQYAVTRILAEAETLHDAARDLLGVLGEILGWDRALLWEIAADSFRLQYVDGWQPQHEPPSGLLLASHQQTFGPGEGIPGEAWRTGQPVWIPNVREQASFRSSDAAAREQIATGVAFPIRLRDEVLGVIELFSREQLPPDADLSLLMVNIGSQIGQFIERRRAERERKQLERQFYEAQKMEAVGHLAGGVAHDFNNVLTAILGYCELLLEETDGSDPRRADVQEIKRAGETAASLTRQLLTFSRRELLQSAVVDLNEIIGRVEKLLRRLIGENIEIVLRLEPGLPLVRADTGQLEQVIMNLAVNARDAMPVGGVLTIQTARTEVNETLARSHMGLRPGEYVELCVRDTGHGMPPEVQARLFEPFFTTKERGKGTGLGLATAYGIVKQSHGHIWVSSAVGRGATFRILLPVASEVTARSTTMATGASASTGSETILVVENDHAIRELTRKVLERQGYRVLTAEHARAALEIASSGRHINLVVTDVVMPGGMSGSALAGELARVIPGVKVVYTSGDMDDALEEGLAADGVFLEKPFTPDQLLKRVRTALEA